MINVSYFAAFLGGMLTLLPACGPLVLPAFFAYSFRDRQQLFEMTLVFFGGFLAAFLPLGLGLVSVSRLFFAYGRGLFVVAGVLLMVFGVLAALGKGLPLAFSSRPPDRSDPGAVFLFGLTFGVAGFGCTAPILGAVLTVVGLSESLIRAVAILVTFSLGLFSPLLLLSLLFERWRLAERFWRRPFRFRLQWRGRSATFYLPNVVAGAVFAVLGASFALTGSPTPFAALATRLGLWDIFFAANSAVLTTVPTVPDWFGAAFLVVLLLAVIFLVWRRQQQRGRQPKLYPCTACGLVYLDPTLAVRCERWCSEHQSCNLEITQHAVIADRSATPSYGHGH